MTALTPPSFQYRVTASHCGSGVGQYDFASHGRDVAAARAQSPQTRNRLALLVFAPHHAWETHTDIGQRHTGCEVSLAQLGIDAIQLRQVAKQIFEPMLGDQIERLVVYQKDAATAMLQLPTLLLPTADTMRMLYEHALRDSMSRQEAAVYSKLISQWLVATIPGVNATERASAVIDPAEYGVTRLQLDGCVKRLMHYLGQADACRITPGIHGNLRLTVTLPTSTVKQLKPTMNAMLFAAARVTAGVSHQR